MNARLSMALLIGAFTLGMLPAKSAFAGHGERPFVSITSPRMGDCVPGPNVTVEICAGGICLQACGNNVHFMLDDEPFEVQFDRCHPHVFQDVQPGTHTIRAYLANSMHEALAGTLDYITFSVAYPDDKNRLAHGAAVLTYGLPQGEYLGLDCADIAVSYLVDGTTLSPRGYKVNYYVDGKRYIAYDTAPKHVQGLAPGYHTVRIELLDDHNNLVAGPYNSAERAILLSPDKPMRTRTANPKSPELPTLSSIHGAMTMGMPTTEREPLVFAKPLGKESGLTVKREAAPVRLPKAKKSEDDENSQNSSMDSDSKDEPAGTNLSPPSDGDTNNLDTLRNEDPMRNPQPTPYAHGPSSAIPSKVAPVTKAAIRYTPQTASVSNTYPSVIFSAPAPPVTPANVSMANRQPQPINQAPRTATPAPASTFEKEIPNADDVATSESDPAPTGLFAPK